MVASVKVYVYVWIVDGISCSDVPGFSDILKQGFLQVVCCSNIFPKVFVETRGGMGILIVGPYVF